MIDKEEGDVDKYGDGAMRRILGRQKPKDDGFEYGKNSGNPPIVIKHSELEREDGESAYKSKCPACDRGILLVRRSQNPPFELLEHDRCIACAQSVVYSDIEDMRKGK